MREKFSLRKEATRITAVYLLFGLSWILFSDGFVHLFTMDKDTLYKINIIKGWFYVLITAALVYYLINRYLQKISQTMGVLQQKETLLLSLLDSIPDLIFYKDIDGVYMGCNKAFEQFVGKPCARIIGSTDLDLFPRDVAESFRAMDVAMMSQKQQRKNEEEVTYPDGHKVDLETLKTPYYDKEGNVLGLIGVSRDISERKAKELEILYLNNTDVLTGLYNRRYYEKEKERLDQYCPLPFSVIMADLNGLKLINDSFGHSKGDAMLVETGRLLKKHSRNMGVVARIGGDEFCMLLPETDSKAAKKIIDKITAECERTSIDMDGTSVRLSISFGHGPKCPQKRIWTRSSICRGRHAAKQAVQPNDQERSDRLHPRHLVESHETAEQYHRMTNMAKKIGEEPTSTTCSTLELSRGSLRHRR